MQSSDEATRLLNDLSINDNKQLSAGQTTYLTHSDLSRPLNNINPAQNISINTTGKKVGTTTAYIFTTMSMIIQGFLAFLLWEVIWRNLAREVISSLLYEIVLYFVGVPLFVGSVIGKVGLVIPYNKESFQRLAQSIFLLLQDPKEWLAQRKRDWQQLTMKDALLLVPNIIMTIIAATVFGVGLTNLGVNGIARLLSGYNKPFLNSIAEFIVTKYFQSPFIFASMVCNLLGFPSIHSNAATRLLQFLSVLIMNPSYFHMQEDVKRCLLAANLQFKMCAEEKNNNKLNHIINQLFRPIESGSFNININELSKQQVDEILRNKISLVQLIQLGRPTITSVKIEYGFEFVSTRSIAVLILSLVLRGLFNFFNYSEKTMELLGLSYLSIPAGILDYLSMCSIGLDAVFLPTVNFLKSLLFGRRYQANIISFPAQSALATLTTILIGLGGFPNGYQQAQLGGSRLEVGIAVFAAWIELFGTYNLIKNPIEQYKIKRNNYDQLIYNIQRQMDEIIDEFSKLSPAEVKHLAQLYVAPEQSEKIQMINPQRKSYLLMKESIRHCIWQRNNNTRPKEENSAYQETLRVGVF